jgi:hypothetical protein
MLHLAIIGKAAQRRRWGRAGLDFDLHRPANEYLLPAFDEVISSWPLAAPDLAQLLGNCDDP